MCMPIYRPQRRYCSEPRKTLKSEMIEMIESCDYVYEVKCDTGNGKVDYDGCEMNLLEILRSSESKVKRMTVKSDAVKRFKVTVDSLGWTFWFEFAV